MNVVRLPVVAGLTLLLTGFSAAVSAQGRATGWLNWRGPQQDGTSREAGLPETWTPGGANHLWDLNVASRGTPVIANGRVYVFGYRGEGPDLQEVLLCADAATGRELWTQRFNDFLSDIIYTRYAIGSPTVDPETGNVYALSSAGIFACFTGDGKPVWQHSLMEKLGRLTFPNGRTGSPLVDDDLVIIRAITSNWGAEGPAMDRFYAYDKKSGKLVWSASPGTQPKDNSFARPLLGWRNGKRVMYTGTGCGHVVCMNVRTGETLWRYPISQGGVNASLVEHKGKLIAIHDAENLDSSEIGRMVAIRMDAEPKPSMEGPPALDRSAEAWRNDLGGFSTSPVLVGDRLYQMTTTGMLCAVDANTGRVLWRHRLGPDQLHASPLYADGKLYVPLHNGLFYILKTTDTGVTELSKQQLAGNCLGAPAVWGGKVYVTSTEKLYCFGRRGSASSMAAPAESPRPRPGQPVALQILPAEVLVQPGEKVSFTIRGIDANGFVTGTYDSARARWAKYIPPTARVRAELSAEFNDRGELVAAASGPPSAGAFEATIDGLKGYIRGRILPGMPLTENFESFDLAVPHPTEAGVKFAYPPLPWIGARFKWEIRDLEGAKVLAKSLDNVLFQRAITFFGQPDAKNYTIEADVMSDGNRRSMSTVGLVNQRYIIALLGNSQELEVSSNHERIRVTQPFQWQPRVWYRMQTRVDTRPDGSGVVRARVWKRGDPQPEAWTLEVPHKNAHLEGSPGLFGFSPQSKFAVYVDNIAVTPNR